MYLPAGWAHQVTSEAAAGDAADDGLHAAINMWFAVPGGLSERRGGRGGHRKGDL